AFLRVGHYGERLDLWLRDLDDPQGISEVNLTASLSGVTISLMPAWSPDGSRLAFAAGTTAGTDMKIYVHDFNSGTTAAVSPPGFMLPFWSESGDTLGFVTINGSTYMQYVLSSGMLSSFNGGASPKWGRVFIPGSAAEYAYLTDFNGANFQIIAPSVPTGTRGIGVKVECPECGLLVHSVVTEGAWTVTDLRDIFAGVANTAEAVRLQFGGELPHNAFRLIFRLPEVAPALVFEKSSADDTYCFTAYPRITCYAGNDLSEYTVVHELGHAFLYLTGGQATPNTFYALLREPGSNGGPLYDSGYENPGGTPTPAGIVMGSRTSYQSNRLEQSDWTRGQRGWGSAAASTQYAPTGVPCDFQQNAFMVFDPQAGPGQTDQETFEAAGDMFLNWVYSRVAPGSGFQNKDWRTSVGNCASTGIFEPQNPGHARYFWMTNNVMPALATWFPTVTSTPSP
ncbi:MAG: hypothetical protein L6Q98_25155, partial [Anaerolineae bacterium]|nr:hypothetical protein [Anaerolineae bacterium]